jgi:hypothetical protein
MYIQDEHTRKRFHRTLNKKRKKRKIHACVPLENLLRFPPTNAHHRELAVKEWYEKNSWETPNKATANQRMPRNSQLPTQELNTV